MSADFWAGYISGAVGIIIGNPLDVIKVQLQAQSAPSSLVSSSLVDNLLARHSSSATPRYFPNPASWVTGTAAPILGYGALNALLFVSYNRTEAFLNSTLFAQGSLWSTWIAGAVGGLATWAVSTPTELIKCRAQLATPSPSSWAIAKSIWQTERLKGLYFGGTVTALRDSIGYGFYFWSYELSSRLLEKEAGKEATFQTEAAKVLLCGGLAGVMSWASVFPLDFIKTRVQTQPWNPSAETSPLLDSRGSVASRRQGARHLARQAYSEGGVRVFFRGLTVCSVRAFIVNAVQWAVYEWMMHEMGQGRKERASSELPA